MAFGFSGRMEDEMECLQGFREIADPAGWQCWMLHENMETQLRRLLDKGLVDAVAGSFISAQWVKSLPESLHVVHRGVEDLGEGISSVSLDLEKGCREVVRHFREMGVEKIVHFAPQKSFDLPWIRSGASLREFLSRTDRAGVFCPTDYLARRAVQTGRDLGKRIPDELAVAGMGDRLLDRLMAEMELTSLPVPHREMGRQTARLLMESLDGRPPRRIRLSPGRLIPRQSSLRTSGTGLLRHRLEEKLLPVLVDPPPVEEWAREMGMSRRSFEKAFSRETGKTPWVYFMEMRCREAQTLLRETDRTVSQIGQQVGMADPARFSAFFRKQTGHTPSEWRKMPT